MIFHKISDFTNLNILPGPSKRDGGGDNLFTDPFRGVFWGWGRGFEGYGCSQSSLYLVLLVPESHYCKLKKVNGFPRAQLWLYFYNVFSVFCTGLMGVIKENRIYIRVEFTRKKGKTAILLYCFHTAGELHIFMLYKTFWAPGTSF